jgi:hypothetical protein
MINKKDKLRVNIKKIILDILAKIEYNIVLEN